MQEGTITLTVDTENDGVNPATQVLTRAEETVNRTTYEFATHSLVAKDIVQFYRTYPKRSGNSRGNAKCAIKVTTDVSVDNADGSGEIVLPLIGEVSFSIPVGVTPAQTMVLRQRLVSLLDDDDVSGVLNDSLHI